MTRSQRIIAQFVFWLYIAAVLYLCFGKFGNIQDVPRSIWGIPTDKIVHFCMFFPFPILAFFAFDKYTEDLRKSLIFCTITFLTGVLIAAGTEYVQSFLPYRTGDSRDLLADILALVASAILVFIIDISKQRRHA